MARFRRLSAGLHIEVCFVLLVGETGNPQYASRVGRGGIATKLARHCMQETFGLFEIHALDFPDNLMLLGRTIQNVIRLGDDTGILNSFEGFRASMIQVEIDMPDGLDLFLGSCCGIFLEWVHAYIDVRAVRVLVAKPGLKFGACGFLCASDALDGFTEVPVEHEHGNAVGGLEIVENVFRSGRGWPMTSESLPILYSPSAVILINVFTHKRSSPRPSIRDSFTAQRIGFIAVRALFI